MVKSRCRTSRGVMRPSRSTYGLAHMGGNARGHKRRLNAPQTEGGSGRGHNLGAKMYIIRRTDSRIRFKGYPEGTECAAAEEHRCAKVGPVGM